MNLKIMFQIFPNLRKIYFFAILVFSSVMVANAQTVSGTVSAEGEPLPGASVSIKGISTGTSTDFDGKYSIKVDYGATLVFSYVGFSTKEVVVGNQKTINVTLDSDNKLDEIVVIGYGTQRKSDLTGAVSTISAKDVAELPVSRVDQALQGRAAGVQITQTSGAPGAGTSIRVRGGNSITGSNQPLWVIDGIIVGTNFNLNNLNANDVKSIEVLKDASSIAIYGSRGANGVILVSTKNGNNVGGGKPQVSVGMYSSLQLVPERPDFLSQEQQIDYTNQDAILRGVTEPFPGNPSNYPNNDFFDRLLSPSVINNIDVSVAGSSENGSVSYYNSLNFFDQDGLIENSGIQKYIFRSNLDFNISEKLKAGVRINYSRIKQKNGVVGYSGLLGILPTQPIYNADGSFNGANEVTGNPFNNPVATAQLDIDETTASNFLGTVYLEYSPIENLIVRSTFNPNITNSKRNEFTSSQRPDLQTGDSNAKISTVSSISWNNENTIQYSGDIGEDHSYTVLGGASFQKDVTESVSAQAFGFTTDATTFNSLQTGSDPARNILRSGFEQRTLVSFFGRLNYTYKDKYLLTLVGRSDGSSVFAPGNKYEFYPSIAAAWKISEEPFMQNQDIFKDLKLRTSYGKSGNQAIDPYRTLANYTEANTSTNGVEVSGALLGRPANPNLIWETTTSFDLALEASLFGGRVFTEFNYYTKKTEDLLLDVTIPRQTGYPNQLQNIGSLENKGWEFLINTKNIQKENFNWNSTLTLSSNKNKILDLGGEDFIDVSIGSTTGAGNLRLIVGETAPAFTGVQYLGTWKNQADIDASGQDPATNFVGGPKYRDTDGDGDITNEDFEVLGNPFPDLIYGFENNFSYKNFNLSIYIQGTVGNEVFNLRTRTSYFTRGEVPKYAEVANYWSPQNPTSDIPRPGLTEGDYQPNSFDVEDGSHLRLKNVRFTYNFPIEKMGWKGVKDMSIYANGTNLLLLSDFRLIDPETNAFGNQGLGNLAQGFSNGEYPNARVISLGFNVTF